MNRKEKITALMKKDSFQAIAASLICIVLGLLVGFVALLIINPSGAVEGISDLIKNFFNYPNPAVAMKYFGSTLVKTAPLIMCSLSILFAYKVGLFNIGCAGQYAAGAGLALYSALAWNLPWWICMILAMAAGAFLGMISGALKAYRNVNEVISGIMLNWITLYSVNMLLTNVKEPASPYTLTIKGVNKEGLIPNMGLDKLFNDNQYVTLAVPLAIIIAVFVWIILDKTKFGYELRATGCNKHAAKYCGMAEKRNIIITLGIGGALAGLGAAMLYLSGFEQWQCSLSSVPAMGFNGIASAFLGGLNPIGAVFSSFFIEHITIGGAYVDRTMYCSQISDLISAIIIYLCGFSLFIKFMINKRVAKREEKAQNKEGGEK